jgi:hypothetical protein
MKTFTIDIYPDIEEITRKNNVFSCEFNNKKIRWCIAYDCNNLSEENETNLKMWLQNAIALSSKSWQIAFFLNNGLPFSSDIFIDCVKIE